MLEGPHILVILEPDRHISRDITVFLKLQILSLVQTGEWVGADFELFMEIILQCNIITS